MTFDQSISAVTGKNVVFKDVNTNAVVATIAADDTSQVAVSGSQVTITPSTPLPAYSYLYINVDSGAFVGAFGNFYGGISDNSTWFFGTIEAHVHVLALNPTNSAVNVPIHSPQLIVRFDQGSLSLIAGKNITVRKASDNSVVETISTDSGRIVLGAVPYGYGLDITTTTTLATSTAYYVTIDADLVETINGLPFAGIAGNSTWAFTTAAPFNDPLVWSEVRPAGATDLSWFASASSIDGTRLIAAVSSR